MKKALLFGFNKYASQSWLRGCVNDAVAVEGLLQNTFGYQTEILLDESIYSGQFLNRIREHFLPEAGETAGCRVLYVAGHGSRTFDSQPGDEIDGIDELLCLPAYKFGDERTYALDDRIGEILVEAGEQAPWLKIFVILDSCHSGTGIRKVTDDMGWHIIDTQAKHMFGVTSPLDLNFDLTDPRMPMLAVPRQANDPIGFEIKLKAVGEKSVLKRGGLSKIASESTGPHLLLSGCKANQTCKELPIDDQYRGIFSYNLVKICASNPMISWSELTERLNLSISDEFDQNPQLEGSDELKMSSMFI